MCGMGKCDKMTKQIALPQRIFENKYETHDAKQARCLVYWLKAFY